MSQQYYTTQDIIAHQQRLKKYIPSDADIQILSHIMYEFDPTAFEYFVAFYYASIEGYQTMVMGGYDDEGVDVIGQNGNKKILIQCKKYITQNIKKEHVGYFYGLTVHETADSSIELIYVATSRYTPNAKTFCKNKGITIKNYFDVISMANSINWQEFEKYTIKHGISIAMPRQLTTNIVVNLHTKIARDSSFEEEMMKRKKQSSSHSTNISSYFESIVKDDNKNSQKKRSYFDEIMKHE